MNGIIQKIIDNRTKKTSVLLLGIDGSGKTTLKEALCQFGNPTRKPKRIRPTSGLNTETIHDKNILIRLWDLSGQSTFRSLWDDYLSSADAVIYVVNGAQETRIHETRKIFDDLSCRFDKNLSLVFLHCDRSIFDIFPSADRAKTFFIDIEQRTDINELYEWIKSTSRYV